MSSLADANQVTYTREAESPLARWKVSQSISGADSTRASYGRPKGPADWAMRGVSLHLCHLVLPPCHRRDALDGSPGCTPRVTDASLLYVPLQHGTLWVFGVQPHMAVVASPLWYTPLEHKMLIPSCSVQLWLLCMAPHPTKLWPLCSLCNVMGL